MSVSQLLDIHPSSGEVIINKAGIYTSSILAMMVLFFVGVALPTSQVHSLVWGLAVGGMTSLWAGPGFGVMLASARVAVIEEQHAHANGL